MKMKGKTKMKSKGVILKWNVLLSDINRKEIINYNIFGETDSFAKELHKQIKQKKVFDDQSLRAYLRGQFMYRYWCKAEYEIAVGGLDIWWLDNLNEIRKRTQKIDAFRQIEMNFDRIVEYVKSKMNINF